MNRGGEIAINSMGSADVDAVVKPKAVDGRRGVMPLVGKSARNKQVTAFLIMFLPFIGFLASLYWIWTGRATAIDYTLFGIFYFLHMLGITAGFHRYVAHKTFSTSGWFEGFLMICGSLAGKPKDVRNWRTSAILMFERATMATDWPLPLMDA